jgi:ribosomal protein S17
MTVTTHNLKVHPQYFREIKAGRKNWELRLNDRDFQIGDYLYLREFDPESKTYTGEEIVNLKIVYILENHYALKENYVIISFPPFDPRINL